MTGTEYQTAIAALIERVGKATGPDREIDLDLADAFGFIAEAFAEQGLRFDPNAVDRGPKFFHDPGMCGGMGFNWAAPDFTASIDAALALVERMLPIGTGEGKWHWYVDDRTAAVWPDGVYDESEVSAATPALALVLALLASLRSLQTGDAK